MLNITRLKKVLNIPDGDFVCITIQDTGFGIPLEVQDKIFDPYYSTKQEGSGLGLAICHSIILKHDGHIAVQSIPGEGTTFSIYLPAVTSTDVLVNTEKKVEIRSESSKSHGDG